MRAKTKWNTARVRRAKENGAFRSLTHGIATIAKTAKFSIRRRRKKGVTVGVMKRDIRGKYQKMKRREDYAAPGNPPKTKHGQLKRAIQYVVDRRRQYAIAGVTVSQMGKSAMPHELGGRYHGRSYPKRPFMFPALKKNIRRIPRFWKESVK